MLQNFLTSFWHYMIEILPSLAAGFFISGIIKELIPTNWVERYLGKKGFAPIVYATLIGTIAPVCCWGSLPIAVSFHKKGARLGPIFAFLVATPATSVSALLVSWRFLGWAMTVFIFWAVIMMGLIMGAVGNAIKSFNVHHHHQHEHSDDHDCACHDCDQKKTFRQRAFNVLRYAFITLPKEIGIEIIVGLALAALVSTFDPIGVLIRNYLTGFGAYVFSLVTGLTMYVCSTMSVPLVHALIAQGMNTGAALGFLILGPIASFGTILVLRKEFGLKILLLFLGFISALSLLAGYLWTLL